MGKSMERNHSDTGVWGWLTTEGGAEALRSTLSCQNPQLKHKVNPYKKFKYKLHYG